MLEHITDENSLAYQRIGWEALKGSITGLINKALKGSITGLINISNVSVIIQDQELLQENRQRPAVQVQPVGVEYFSSLHSCLCSFAGCNQLKTPTDWRTNPQEANS